MTHHQNHDAAAPLFLCFCGWCAPPCGSGSLGTSPLFFVNCFSVPFMQTDKDGGGRNCDALSACCCRRRRCCCCCVRHRVLLQTGVQTWRCCWSMHRTLQPRAYCVAVCTICDGQHGAIKGQRRILGRMHSLQNASIQVLIHPSWPRERRSSPASLISCFCRRRHHSLYFSGSFGSVHPHRQPRQRFT